ncbi:MAG: hypothetical protein ACOYT8_02530 [Candidatus Dependentiae bacterium]
MKKILSVALALVMYSFLYPMENSTPITHNRIIKNKKFSETDFTTIKCSVMELVNNKISNFFADEYPQLTSFAAVREHVKNGVKTYVKKNSETIIQYHCPYKNCQTIREKNINEVASCFLSHYDHFFHCPQCDKSIKNIERLWSHIKKSCKKQRQFSQPLNNTTENNVAIPIPSIIIKLKNQPSTDQLYKLPKLIINNYQSPLNICASKKTDFDAIENQIEQITSFQFDSLNGYENSSF